MHYTLKEYLIIHISKMNNYNTRLIKMSKMKKWYCCILMKC